MPKTEGPLSISLLPGIEKIVTSVFEPLGLEANPFHIGWYNDLVGEKFQLDYPYNTVALVVISGPDTFEKCVIRYLQAKYIKTPEFYSTDPLDESMKYAFNAVQEKLKGNGFEVEMYHDFDLHPNRRPKVLVQTAAHVSGVVEYFHQDQLSEKAKAETSQKKQKFFGVAIHHEYSGWYAIRGVIIFTNLVRDKDNLFEKPNRPILISDEYILIQLLEQFSFHWQTNKWRDIIPRKNGNKYSEEFQDYLNTPPDMRWNFIKSRGFLS